MEFIKFQCKQNDNQGSIYCHDFVILCYSLAAHKTYTGYLVW